MMYLYTGSEHPLPLLFNGASGGAEGALLAGARSSFQLGLIAMSVSTVAIECVYNETGITWFIHVWGVYYYILE
jgi:hypothetical protein